MLRRLLPLCAALTAAATLLPATSALAAKNLEIGIADDGVTQRTPGLAPQVIPEWRRVGIDSARVLVIWGYVAPEPEATRRPAGFDPTDPNDPRYAWGPVDEAVSLLLANGIKPVLSVTGFGPVWGSRVPSRRNGRYKPDPDAFAAFAGAAARRYGGVVDEWIFFNEPNIALWLQPQFDCKGKRCTPRAPHEYRRLALKGIPAIKAADPGAKVYGPAIAPRGSSPRSRNATMRPRTFLRALGCVDSKYRRYRKGSCRGFKPATLDGIAYHPHGVTRSPTTRNPNRDEASMADLGRLFAWVDRIQRAGGLRNGAGRTRKFDFHFTEWGYQTNPPDPIQGVSRSAQARWAQQGAYIAWKKPRVRSLVQYLWRDDPVRDTGRGAAAYSGWQSGLYSFDGRAKPLRRAFPNPFWVDLPRGRRTATVWGQVRPGPGRTAVTVQRRRGGGSYTTLRRVTTDARGYFSFRTIVRSKTSFRFRYVGEDGRQVTSSTMTVAPR